MNQTVLSVFKRCVEAIREGVLIQQISNTDKEYHFQNWFESRLAEAGKESGFDYEVAGRNIYPDFRIVSITEGYEVKGLAYPGRDASYDSNGQVPTGFHNGRNIYYVFGRYPKTPDGKEYPVLDLVFCHGDFLNVDHTYVHKNKSVKGFGSYGDILIRDRKMYVVPTPFRIGDGLAHQYTLILPDHFDIDASFFEVGELIRTEAENIIVGYSFDLQTSELTPQTIQNPSTGTKHIFRAWRLKGSPSTPVTMRDLQSIGIEDNPTDDVFDR